MQVEQKSKEQIEMEQARQKLAERLGDSRTGGKGAQRRKVKVVHKTQITDDKKLKNIIKKYGVQPFPGIDEVNMFKDDKTILHFNRPEVLASFQNNTYVIIGKSETKTIKDLLPDVLQHLGPKQLDSLKDIMNATQEKRKQQDVIQEQDGNQEDDEIPQLQQNFEEISKVE